MKICQGLRSKPREEDGSWKRIHFFVYFGQDALVAVAGVTTFRRLGWEGAIPVGGVDGLPVTTRGVKARCQNIGICKSLI